MSTIVQASPTLGNTTQIVQRVWWSYLLWVAAAAVLGFAIAGVGATWLRLPRNLFLIPYVVLVGLFVYAYRQWSGVSVAELVRHNWIWGLVGAVLVGLFLVRNILS
jgi:hypothetical protein